MNQEAIEERVYKLHHNASQNRVDVFSGVCSLHFPTALLSCSPAHALRYARTSIDALLTTLQLVMSTESTQQHGVRHCGLGT